MIGILNDKDYINIAKIISPIFDKIIITSVPTSRGKDPAAVFEEFKKNGIIMLNSFQILLKLL